MLKRIYLQRLVIPFFVPPEDKVLMAIITFLIILSILKSARAISSANKTAGLFFISHLKANF